MKKIITKILGVNPFVKKKKDQLKTSTTPVSLITIVTITCVICGVCLFYANSQQINTRSLVLNRPSPANFYAKVNFEFEDIKSTELLRKEAKQQAPKIFILNQNKIKKIETEFYHFFSAVKKYKQSNLKDHIPSRITKYVTTNISDDFLTQLYSLGRFPESKRLLGQLQHGIMSITDKEKNGFNGNIPIKIELPNGIRRSEELTLNDFLDPTRIANYYGNLVFPNNKDYAKTLAEITANIIGKDGTLIYDEKKTIESEEDAARKVKPVKTPFLKNTLLISEKEIFNHEKNILIKAHDTEAIQKKLPTIQNDKLADPLNFLYNIIIASIIITVCGFFLYHLYPQLIPNAKNLVIISIIVNISIGLNYSCIQFFNVLSYIKTSIDPKLIISAIPVALAPIMLTVITGYRSAICCGFLTSSITAMMIMPHESFELALRWFAIGSLSGLMVKNVKNYRTFCVKTLFFILITTTLINLDIILKSISSYDRIFEELVWLIGISTANAFLVSVLALLLLFLFELTFNLDTDMALVAFSDFSHKVLERLKREAPGTLFHSMSVATLAEDAAKAIGANPLKAKVASLFHDIGKLHNPEYFIENNRDSSSMHLKLKPQTSSIIIRDHVKEGLALAKKEHLPRWIREAIRTHHGDDLVYFFYAKALNQKHAEEDDNDPVLEMQFRYDGPPPTDKELVILSLADACEAASRCIDHPNSAKLKNLVNQIFQQRIKNDQLRNANITLAELNIIKESFIQNLISSNHGRIAYTPENINAKPSLPVEKFSSSQTIQE